MYIEEIYEGYAPACCCAVTEAKWVGGEDEVLAVFLVLKMEGIFRQADRPIDRQTRDQLRVNY